jgi:hypothetical protein
MMPLHGQPPGGSILADLACRSHHNTLEDFGSSERGFEWAIMQILQSEEDSDGFQPSDTVSVAAYCRNGK